MGASLTILLNAGSHFMQTEIAQKQYASFYERNKVRLREEKRIAMRIARLNDPEKYRAQSRKAKAREREKLFELYGHVCARCGFDDKRALTLDHRLNNGSEERATLGERGVYKKAKAIHSPDEYQILCMNCQFIKRTEDGRANQHGNREFERQHGECLEVAE